jgi:hypothetical protein
VKAVQPSAETSEKITPMMRAGTYKAKDALTVVDSRLVRAVICLHENGERPNPIEFRDPDRMLCVEWILHRQLEGLRGKSQLHTQSLKRRT